MFDTGYFFYMTVLRPKFFTAMSFWPGKQYQDLITSYVVDFKSNYNVDGYTYSIHVHIVPIGIACLFGHCSIFQGTHLCKNIDRFFCPQQPAKTCSGTLRLSHLGRIFQAVRNSLVPNPMNKVCSILSNWILSSSFHVYQEDWQLPGLF